MFLSRRLLYMRASQNYSVKALAGATARPRGFHVASTWLQKLQLCRPTDRVCFIVMLIFSKCGVLSLHEVQDLAAAHPQGDSATLCKVQHSVHWQTSVHCILVIVQPTLGRCRYR